VTNRIAVVIVALVVGSALFLGAISIEHALRPAHPGGLSGTVVATNATIHVDRVGRPTAVGQVVNGLDTPIDNVTVSVTFTGWPGGPATVTDRAILPAIPPGGRSPFVVRLQNETARPTGLSLHVDYSTGGTKPYEGLTVVNSRITEENSMQYAIAGQVKNHGGQPVTTLVAVTFFDRNGSVVGARTGTTSPQVLTRGSTGAFQIQYRTVGDTPSRAADVVRYEVVAWGEPANQSTG